jgi:hypothetical protein
MMDRVHDTTTPHNHGGPDDSGHTPDECSSMDHSMMMVRGYCNDTMHVA